MHKWAEQMSHAAQEHGEQKQTKQDRDRLAQKPKQEKKRKNKQKAT